MGISWVKVNEITKDKMAHRVAGITGLVVIELFIAGHVAKRSEPNSQEQAVNYLQDPLRQ